MDKEHMYSENTFKMSVQCIVTNMTGITRNIGGCFNRMFHKGHIWVKSHFLKSKNPK